MQDVLNASYNARLFESGGLRSRYHNARYHWVAKELNKLGLSTPRIIELGCFDAKTLNFIDKPSYYLGLDADWENGLTEGRKQWAGIPSVELVKCLSPADIPERGTFDIAISLETLEHIPDDILDSYLAKLSTLVHGKFLISVPRERGILFLLKYLVKTIFFGGYLGDERCSIKDVVMLTLGKTDKVKRCDHKGFDDRRLQRQLSKYFRVERVVSIFPRSFPKFLSVTVGIVASPR